MDETFKTMPNFQTYRLLDRSTRYDSRDAKRTSNWQLRMTTQMRSTHFDGTDPISIFCFLKQFRTAYISNGVQEGATTNVFAFFMTGSPQEEFNDQLAPRARKATDATDAPPSGSTYPQLVQFLLIRYVCEETPAYAYEKV